MNREGMTLSEFEIVVYAGDARSKSSEAFRAAEDSDLARADSLVVEAGNYIVETYNSQATMLAREASREKLPYSVTMMHGQDHLMTTVLLEDMIRHPIEFCERGAK